MGNRDRESIDCPFCSFTTKNEDHYKMLYHVETVHPENSHVSPFAVKESNLEVDSDDAQEMEGAKEHSSEYMECQCGEYCLLTEFESHLEMHYAEGISFDETKKSLADSAALGPTYHQGRALLPSINSPLHPPHEDLIIAPSRDSKRSAASRRSRSEGHKSQGLVQDFIDVLRHSTAPPSRKSSNTRPQTGPQRLGVRQVQLFSECIADPLIKRKELGPHAHEERMPEWLCKQLELGAKVSVFNQISQDGRLIRVETIANEFQGIIPVLGQLCEQDPSLSRVYLCHPDVTHVVKMAREGGFCGYRNIQMLISYIRDAHSEGHQRFLGRLPSIIQLQDMIENAWDRGFNQIGRIETGGIRGTRKYIGTPEVCLSCGARAVGADYERHKLYCKAWEYSK